VSDSLVRSHYALIGGYGNQLLVKCASRVGCARFRVRLRREHVQLQSGEAPSRSDQLRADALVEVESVVSRDYGLPVRLPESPGGAERHPTHHLDTTGDDVGWTRTLD
jgi:hypothetical protein